jgi:endoglucanase
MKNLKLNWLSFVLFLAVGLFGCKKEKDVNTLVVSPQRIEIEASGSFTSLTINTNAASWEIANTSDWVILSNSSGTNQTALITIGSNTLTATAREVTLTITAGNAVPVEIVVSQAASEFIYSITSNLPELNFSRTGNTLSLRITTDAPSWTLSDDANWLSYSTETGLTGNTFVNITAAQNTEASPRTATITLHAEFAPDVLITVKQNGELYPGYNTNPLPPDQTGMTSTAMQIANQMTIGWNIGNTMEAIGGETAWGNPMISPALIQLVKESGFNAVRIPCSFNQYMENASTAKLKQQWLDRIKTVVQICMDQDVYVLLNIHWDGGWLENNVTVAAQEANNAKQKAFWEQIATHLRDFDERLLFAGTNEPNVENATQMAVLNSYLQTFIDAVRSTGGRNYYRTLVVQGPSTDIEKTHLLMNTLPVDVVENRMMVEVHYYTPWNFCGMTEDASWGRMFYYWGAPNHSTTDPERNPTYGEEADMEANFALMYSQFAQKGIPVILGEFSATRRSTLTGESLLLHNASRAYFNYYVTKKARANGMIPFYWDNGGIGNHACGIFNRINNTVFDQQSLDGLMQGLID